MSIARFNIQAICLTLIAIFFIDANAEPMGRIFWHLLTIHDLPAAWLMVATLVVAGVAGLRRGGDGVWIGRMLLAIERYRHAVAIVLWAVLCLASVFVYRNHPLSMDEYAAIFQGKVFAAGTMHGQFPPELMDLLLPRGFQNHFLMVNRNTGAVFSAYWPGFSMLLAPFVALGIPWACNPTIVAASFLLIGCFAREVTNSPLGAGWAMLFALASPAFIASGITYYSMSAHLLLNLAFAWLLLAPTPRRLVLAGLVGGFALVLHNPFPHLVFAAPWIIWLMLRPGRSVGDLGWLALGYLPVITLLGVGWSLWQREILKAGANVVAATIAAADAPSLVERVLALGRGLLRVMQWPNELIVYARLGGLAKLWLWATPLLLLLAWWGGRGEKHAGTRLMGASALLTFFAYFTIRFDQGHGWGYRYFHSAWGVLPILAAMGALKLVAVEGGRAMRQIAILSLCSLVVANSLRFFQIGEFMGEHLAHFPPREETKRHLVVHSGIGYYADDLIQNDPWLRGKEIVILGMKPVDTELLLGRYPGLYVRHRNRYGDTYVEEEPAVR